MIESIELTNHCDGNCSYCPQPKYMKREKGFMDLKTAKSLLPLIEEKQFLNFSFFGEILLHPDYGKITRLFVNEKKVFAHCNSNGIQLVKNSDSHVKRLNNSKLSKILFQVGPVFNKFGADGLTKLFRVSKRLKMDVEFLDFYTTYKGDESDVAAKEMNRLAVKQSFASAERVSKKYDIKVRLKEMHSWTEGKEISEDKYKKCPFLTENNRETYTWKGDIAQCCADYDCKGTPDNPDYNLCKKCSLF